MKIGDINNSLFLDPTNGVRGFQDTQLNSSIHAEEHQLGQLYSEVHKRSRAKNTQKWKDDRVPFRGWGK